MGRDSTTDDSNAHQKTLAEKLHKNRIIYLLFGLGDGLSNSSSVISYIIQLSFPTDPAPQNQMHAWLMSPLGIALTIIEATLITFFSMIGFYFQDKRDGTFKSAVARFWPYVRDGIKGSKNAYKAVRSVLFIAVIFGAPALALSGLLLPLGIVFGVAYLFTRAWNRSMVYDRLNMEEVNAVLVHWNGLHLNPEGETPTLKDKDKSKSRQELINYNPILKKIISNIAKEKQLILEQVKLTPEDILANIQTQSNLLRAKAYVSAAFSELMNGLYLYAGIYLLCTLIPPLALVVNIFSLFFAVTSVIRGIYEEYTYQTKLERSAIKAKIACRSSQQRDITELEKRLNELDRINYLSAIGEALRNGLSAYSAMTGCIFAISLFTPIPMICVMITIALGGVSVLGFVSHHLWYTHQALKADPNATQNANVTPDRLEVLRSFTAGVRQGPKSIRNFILNDIRDSKAALIVTGIVSAIQAFVFAGKALAKGCRPPDKNQTNPILQPINSLPQFSTDCFSPTSSTPPEVETDQNPVLEADTAPQTPPQGLSPFSKLSTQTTPTQTTPTTQRQSSFNVDTTLGLA